MLKAIYDGHKKASQIGVWNENELFGVINIIGDYDDVPIIVMYSGTSHPDFADELDRNGEQRAELLNKLFRRLTGEEKEYTGPSCARCGKHPPEVELTTRRLTSFRNWPKTGKSPERYYCSTKCFGEDQMAHQG